MYFLGFDIGSSSVKVSLLNGENGECVGTSFSPKTEMKIDAPQTGWAEQHPDLWWENLKIALGDVLKEANIDNSKIQSIGISYQMHGLVTIDKSGNVLRPSIIWCDSRAVQTGDEALKNIGEEKCLSNMLNSPGNFTASKLAWVKQNEPAVYEKIDKIMLPGDYIAYKLSGDINTTVTGLSEGIFWDFKTSNLSNDILNNYGIDKNLIPEIVSVFSEQAKLSNSAAKELSLNPGISISYRGGDQPNNAFSLNVLNPGEVAATAGTSGVVYGVSDQIKYDKASRVNTFAHVNHNAANTRLGVLLCVNGTGILNSWVKNNFAQNLDYVQMNNEASEINPGSDGLVVLPFGNGAERMLNNKNIGAHFINLDLNRHSRKHIFRAIQEGIVFAFKYGMDIMQEVGIDLRVIRAGKANMFLSPIFRNTLASLTNSTIELYNTDGSLGAARAAALGSGYYKSVSEAFVGMNALETIEPDKNLKGLGEAYSTWKNELKKHL